MIIVIFLIIAVILIPMMIRREAIADMVPVDICINLLVCVAWQTARQPKGAPIKVVGIPTMWWVNSQPPDWIFAHHGWISNQPSEIQPWWIIFQPLVDLCVILLVMVIVTGQ